MNQRNSNQKPDLTKLRLVLIPAVVIFLINSLAVGGVMLGDSEAVAVIIAMLAVFIGVFTIIIKGKKKAESSAVAMNFVQSLKEQILTQSAGEQHNHDRLELGNTAEACEDNEQLHWKKQLDSFLECGIIERSEYQALLNRYKK